ncbi:protein of unknown function [Corynebacterium coyleae]|uniref:DUF1707 domain-containing protein n=1 Tax=Corynebacterium coyleae TaxID=53374 RepID=A0ABX8KX58_9CORY|nr:MULTISPECIES: DUF1707 domain-containing protein [Corynebacterium]OHO28914.1 hypothetical protein HMPREF2656_02200 [Corynebacterium sp. HMSC034B08]OHO81147.1 hypothetical protein HMPREF2736_07085 [Corynebacterium sp. HMSC036E10]QXB19172.1 DUF1707 domain-containing protein [Corynebacterium coyleae]WJY80763.1 hypothetical protein CCOY_10965 [Corynebacterium coyleae]SEB49520.1 protein of unknown function [Corynebacterium coyleae]
MSTPYGNFRIGDQERMDAMDILGRALGEGRLDMAEFDNRCQAVAEAQTQQDLQPILGDLPTGRGGGVVDKQVSDDAVLYSQAEIMQARRSGRRTRAGVFWLGTIGSIGLVSIFGAAGSTALSGLSLLIIPTLFILLYVMKVGPDSWYTPSLRQLEQQRRQEIKRRQLEIEAAQVHQQALMRAQRKDQINQMTNDALNIAQDTVNRFRRK